jgi:predicted HTH transcriptional regulator
MNLNDLKLLIEEGEGFQLEFKRKISSSQKIAKTLAAFANTRGGTLLFGVDDDGSLVGIESEKSEVDLVNYAAQELCDPPVLLDFEIVPSNKKDIIVVTVTESTDKPHYVLSEDGEENKVFIRVNDKSVLASREVIKVLRDERPDKPPLTIAIGENERRLFSYLEKNANITVQEFAELVNISDRRASRVLTTLVRASVIRIHTLEKRDYFTLASDDDLLPGESSENRTAQSRTPRRH